MSETLFLETLAATDRKAQNGLSASPLLSSPLHAFVSNALAESRGPLVTTSSSFPMALWPDGATDTEKGRLFPAATIAHFVELLKQRAKTLAPKRRGFVVEPVTNTDGRRANESTIALHALFLDCDGTGEWNVLLDHLRQNLFAFVAYQSGGYTPDRPKWRVVLPLSAPFLTPDDHSRALWKAFYNHARVVFGAIAQLKGVGFDPATETPCNPWFLTEKRNIADPERVVLWHPGHSLSVIDLLVSLPAIEIEQAVTSIRSPVSGEGLTDEKLNEIINVLSVATSSVPSGRHDLYLALPGVLLDRGVPPDEVLAIIEAVSASYPRKHLELHKDNLHNARTTIGKWEGGASVTRIGTLNDRWPTIAKALDDVLPNPVAAAMLAATAEFLAPPPTAASPVSTPTPPAPSSSSPKKRRKLSPLGKEIAPVVALMKKSSNDLRRFGGLLIERILRGESFQTDNTTKEQVDQLVALTMTALGFNLPQAVTWREILDLANVTLLSMDFTQSVERVAAAEQAFLTGQKQRRKWNAKQDAKVEAEHQRSRAFFDAAAKNRNA